MVGIYRSDRLRSVVLCLLNNLMLAINPLAVFVIYPTICIASDQLYLIPSDDRS